jgi:hypothetical protein
VELFVEAAAVQRNVLSENATHFTPLDRAQRGTPSTLRALYGLPEQFAARRRGRAHAAGVTE